MPTLIEANGKIEPSRFTIDIALAAAPSPGDIIIAAVSGGAGNTVIEPSLVGYAGGVFSTTVSRDQIVVVIADEAGTIPTLEWKYDALSDLAVIILHYTEGFLNGVVAEENVDNITFITSPALQSDGGLIVWVGCGVSEGNSLWIMDEEELFGFSPDNITGSPLIGQLEVQASPGFASSGPPIVPANIASASQSDPSYASVPMYVNGGDPQVRLVAGIGIDSVDPDTGTDSAQGWFVGTVGWDKAGWGS